MSVSECCIDVFRQEIHRFDEIFIESISMFNFFYEPDDVKKVHVTAGGIEKVNRKTSFIKYKSQNFVIEYIADGAGQVFFQDNAQPLTCGDMFICAPQMRYRVVNGVGQSLRRFFLVFSGWQVWDFLLHSQIRPGHVFNTSSPAAIGALFEEAVSCGIRNGDANARLCTRLLECILMNAADVQDPVMLRPSPAYATYRQCKAHIEQHFLRLSTLERWSVECRVTAPRLCHLFRVYDSETPYQYLTQLKMRYASTLLRTTDILVKQVAAEVGYKDPFHFSRVFRNYFGIPPEKVRGGAAGRLGSFFASNISAGM